VKGWTGRFLRVNLSEQSTSVQEYEPSLARAFLGGRGFAIKILWDELRAGTAPLSPENILVFMAGPLTGLPVPSSGKLVVAAKSPLTSGYGDGNLGSRAAVMLRRAGYDGIIIKGASDKPVYLYIENEKVEFLNADDLWGMSTFDTEKKLSETHGKDVGILCIGPAGENLVLYANVHSQEGRAGGRPGMGAVMGSKKLKAIVIRGTREIETANPEELKRLGEEGYEEIKKKPNYDFWRRQGTMATVEWSQENSVLPTFNFREGEFENADKIGGYAMEKIKVLQRGCPYCNMICGNVVEDAEGKRVELDYENVAMLGSDIGLGDLKKISVLNRLADEYGIDTISVGNAIGFAMEASEKKLLKEKIEWGDFDAAKTLLEDIVFKRNDIGRLLANGVKYAAEKLGNNSKDWAMQVKGLEISAYDCHFAPAMALSFGTSPIGAHHKDAWVIAWEVQVGRESYTREKVAKVIELQRIRGGVFECLTACRLPWIELGFELDWYPKFLKAATGMEFTFDELYRIADRIYTLIRAFWIREFRGRWGREMDIPPARWFKEPLTKGRYKGKTLDLEKYNQMLSWYYEMRGWDERGVPTKKALKDLGLENIITELEKIITLK